MITSFKHKGLKELFETGRSKHVAASILDRVRQLDVLNAATSINGVNVPGYGLHPLNGNRKGEWSIKVTSNFRITFTPKGENFRDVDLEDYH
jgi:toxin HigB-1